jgi:hypothetical protein
MVTRIKRLQPGRKLLKEVTPERVYSFNDLSSKSYLCINYTYWILNFLRPATQINSKYLDTVLTPILEDYDTYENTINPGHNSDIEQRIGDAILRLDPVSPHKIEQLKDLLCSLALYLYLQPLPPEAPAENKNLQPQEENTDINTDNEKYHKLITESSAQQAFQLICDKYNKATLGNSTFPEWFYNNLLEMQTKKLPDGYRYYPKVEQGVYNPLIEEFRKTLNIEDVPSNKSNPEERWNWQKLKTESTNNPEVVTRFLKTQMGIHFSEGDLEMLLRDAKLIFRAEHLNLIDKELLNWEILYEQLTRALDNALTSFNVMARAVPVDGIQLKALGKYFVASKAFDIAPDFAVNFASMATSGGIPLLIAGPVGVALAAAAGAGILLFILLKPSLKKILEKNGYLVQQTQDFSELLGLESVEDAKGLNNFYRQKINDVRQISIDFVDVTPDIDFQLILDYVYYQTLMGFKVGLDTTYLDTALNEFDSTKNPEIPIKQQDERPISKKHNEPLRLEKNQLVRKARNMLEKAFEYRFEATLKALRMSPEQKKYLSGENFRALERRFELEMWEMWIHSILDTLQKEENKKVKYSKPTGYDEVYKRMKEVAEAESNYLKSLAEYKSADENSALKLYDTWLEKHFKPVHFPEATNYPFTTSPSKRSKSSQGLFYLEWENLIDPTKNLPSWKAGSSPVSADMDTLTGNLYLKLSPFHPQGDYYAKKIKDKDFVFLRDQPYFGSTIISKK